MSQDPYQQNAYQQNPYQQNPYQQNPYQQNPYEFNTIPQSPYAPNYRPPGFNRHYRYSPYIYNRSYQLASNKAKDTKSKLAFYIEIELELFPGKTASMFQKSVIRCQSIFERIREAYADILGYQYRPGAMTDAYAYQYQTNKKK